MKSLSAGQLVAKKRRQLAFSQADLARQSGVRRERISRFESDTQRLNEKEIQALAKVLRTDAEKLRPLDRHPKEAEILASLVKKPFSKRLLPTKVNMASLRARYGTLAETLEYKIAQRPDAAWCEEFLRWSGCDSKDEYLLCVRLLAHPAVTPVWFSPVRAGFTQHPSVDKETGRANGHLKHPALHLLTEGWKGLAFPQITLRPRGNFRLDFLVALKSRGKTVWGDLEVDGTGHDPSYDEKKCDSLALPTVRLSGQEVERSDALSVLLGRLNRWLPGEG